MSRLERGHAGTLVLVLVVAHGGADRSGWHDVGVAMVEGVGARIAVVEGVDIIVVAAAVAAVAIDGARGVAVAAVVIAAGVGMWGWLVRPVRCCCQRYRGVCCCCRYWEGKSTCGMNKGQWHAPPIPLLSFLRPMSTCFSTSSPSKTRSALSICSSKPG